MSDPSTKLRTGPKIVGFVCDWSVELPPLLAGNRLRDLPNVYIIRVPCSGFVRPSWMTDALNQGADGVFVTGCPYGDCLNREGNFLMRDRVDQEQRRLQRRRIDPGRMAMLAHGLHDREAFLADVRAFSDRLAELAAASSKAPAAEPAPAPGGSS